MKILVLGGTAWLGREIAREAVGRGHDVTCLARGVAGEVAAGVRFVQADRDDPDGHAAVAGEPWDAVVDVTRQPGQLRRAVVALEPAAERYLFISSGNVYASQRDVGQDEGAPLLPALAGDVMTSMETYGAAKVACEQAVSAVFGPRRTLIARAGLIGGPGDESGRSGYWPWRFARPSSTSGAVLVPTAGDLLAALIDVRDLASWIVSSAEAGTAGVFNVGGPPRSLSEHLAGARRVAGHTGAVVGAGADWLREHGVQVWSGPRSLPLWLDDPDWYGMNARDCRRARSAGLLTRPLEDTLADTLAWELARARPGPHGAGLTDDEERVLLDALGSGV